MKLSIIFPILAFLATLCGIQAANDTAQYIIVMDKTSHQHLPEDMEVTIRLDSISAVVATLTSEQVKKLQDTDGIQVHPDIEARAAKWEYSAPWGLDRIDQKNLPLDGKYCYSNSDSHDVDAYILDSGILVTHQEFEGRASFAQNFVGDGIDTDCLGHGTMVAGVVGGKTYGVAKEVHLIDVKVLNCHGAGTLSSVLNGVNWIILNHSERSVITMAFEFFVPTPTFDAMVQAAISAGIHVVIAAGNQNEDACLQSPALSPNGIKVAASDNQDNSATFSNYGSCVDLFAPGVGIISSTIPNDNSNFIGSGTSLSAAFVAGAVANLLKDNKWKPSTMKTNILNMATKGLISNPMGSPNKLLYVGHSAC